MARKAEEKFKRLIAPEKHLLLWSGDAEEKIVLPSVQDHCLLENYIYVQLFIFNCGLIFFAVSKVFLFFM